LGASSPRLYAERAGKPRGGRYRLIAPDFRGFGESENPHPQPTDTVNAASLAEDIVALPGAMNIDRCGFVGHDVGANVMQVLGLIP